ncbi:hypothetical protein LCGC14_1540550 [marine sediment metagenome]|uniref:Uncharacterized protein n=1 Tax=marine sediment metagenome TaxID=412755 RepID=A0A0F9IT77_9ZZZZ
MHEAEIQYIREALQQAEGDDLYRAELSFRGMTAEAMGEQYGRSGQTRQQILDEYREHAARHTLAVAFFERLVGGM